jgi:tetratricopeptide (TPR) repeat protein
MVQAGLLEAPEAALDDAIDANSQRADAHLKRGNIRFRLGRHYGALQDARTAVAAAPNDPIAWNLLVRSSARAEGVDAGIAMARQAIGTVGEHAAILPPLAALLAQRGRLAEARSVLQKQIDSPSSDSDRVWNARLALARLELGADNLAGTKTLLDRLLSERPSDQEAIALGAVVEARSGLLDASLTHLDAALASLPTSRSLRETRDRLELARGDPKVLLALSREVASGALGPPPASPRRLRADARIDRGSLGAWTREYWPGRLAEIRQVLGSQLERRDWVAAQRIVDSAARDYPGSAFAPYLAGILELARGNLDEAERRLSEALAIAPRLPATLAALGKTWSEKGGAAFAGQQLMGLAEHDPELPIVRYMAARAYIEAGDPLRAEASLRRGLALQPDSPVPYQHLTDYYFGLDRAPESLEICRQGLTRFPQDTNLLMMLPQIEAAIGRPDAAFRAYEELSSRRPDLDLALYRLAMLLATEEGEPSRQRLLPVLQRLRGDAPSDPLLLDALGSMHYRAGDARLARALLEEAVKRAPEEPTLHYHLALVYSRANEMTLARQQLKNALDSPRPFPDRIEALRLMRQDDRSPPSTGRAAASARGH